MSMSEQHGVYPDRRLCYGFVLSPPIVLRLLSIRLGVFANWAPNLFEYYVIHMRQFYRRYAHLKQPFLNGIWSACTFNLGPQTCALGHRDFANLAFGWCAITALGDFDYTKVPPGHNNSDPKRALFHSNIPIANGERRYSFTQYTAGGIFRWIEHGFQSEESYLEREREEAKTRWQMGAGLFSTLDELKST
ncbi:hypothetical protein B0H13DRAFT_2234722 [Mycena leptocephala]|nr:hypothetical protein B0H13DRAFT_2234722 [Mycena leptocephala]